MSEVLKVAAARWMLDHPGHDQLAPKWTAEFLRQRADYAGKGLQDQATSLHSFLNGKACIFTRSLPQPSLASPRFKPQLVDMGGVESDSADIWKTRLMASLPPQAQEIVSSTSPQEPLVFITRHLAEPWQDIASIFTGGKERTALAYNDGGSMGQDIIRHVFEGWGSPRDADGRPTAWDDEYEPGCKVMEFTASSPMHAYLRVVMGIAEVGSQDVAGASAFLQPYTDTEAAKDGVSDPEMVKFWRSTDMGTKTLFLHFSNNGKIYATIVKLRNMVDDARAWVMDAAI